MPAAHVVIEGFTFTHASGRTVDGQERTGPRDKGADEVATSPVTARLLTQRDVGPRSQPGERL